MPAPERRDRNADLRGGAETRVVLMRRDRLLSFPCVQGLALEKHMDPNDVPENDRDAQNTSVEAEDGSTSERRPEPGLPDDETEILGDFA